MNPSPSLYVLSAVVGIGLGLTVGRLSLGASGAAVCAATFGWAALVLTHRHALGPIPITVTALLCWWSSALTTVDLRCRRLPNVLTLPGALVSTFALSWAGHMRGAVVGAAILTALYLLVHLSTRAGLGAGDVKLAWTVGALTGAAGPTAWTDAALLAPVFTALLGVVVWFSHRADRSVPHGPSMCAATLLVLSTSAS